MSANDEKQEQRSGGDSKVGEAWGSALTRDTSIYLIGAVISFLLALISIYVITHFLTPAEFGQLALLLVFAAFLTIMYNVGTLQGTFMWVFGSAGEEDVADEDGESSQAGTKRRALGTGILITAGICAIGTAIIIPLSPWAAQAMLGDSGKADLIVIAAISGAMGSLWRIIANILRMERKPRRFVALNLARPVFVVSAVIALTAAGGGIEGAITGTALGGALAVAVGVVVTWPSYELNFDRNHAKMILRRGAIYAPIIISIWVAQNVDIYTLSYFTNDDQAVGLYRLANRYGAFLDYFTAALFMAWTPLAQTPAFAATVAQRGREQLGGTLLTYFGLAGLGLVLAMTAAADTLVRIAPSAYSAAAPLIPLMGGAFLSYGLLISVYRLSNFPRKRAFYIGAAFTSAVVFLLAAMVLVPWLEAYGAGAAVIVGFAVGAGVMIYFSQHGEYPLEIEWRRLGAGLLIAGFCLLLSRGVGPRVGSWQPAVELAAFLIYPLALTVFGVISRDDRHAIGRVLGGIVPWRRHAAEVQTQVEALPARDLAALQMTVVGRWPPEKVAAELGADPEQTQLHLVSLLRRVGDAGAATEHDGQIARYMFTAMPVAEHDELGRSLWAEKVDPEDLHTLERVLEDLRRLPKRTWTDAGADEIAIMPIDGESRRGLGRLRRRDREKTQL